VAGDRRGGRELAGGEVQRRWPRRLGERRRGGEICGNKRLWKVHGCLVELLEQWDGGERKRRAPAPGGGGNGGGGSGLARGEVRGAFICGPTRPRVTRGDGGDAPRTTAARGSRVRRRHGRRTGGPRRARAYGGADLGTPREGARWGARSQDGACLGRWGPRVERVWTSGHHRRRAVTGGARVRDVAARRRSAVFCFTGAVLGSIFL
jgi:hypothetical protein